MRSMVEEIKKMQTTIDTTNRPFEHVNFHVLARIVESGQYKRYRVEYGIELQRELAIRETLNKRSN